uniref:D-isomer specific 2-hydroxyacid dehydrogenase NAD-binding domain-containing protein n=1 Tax=Branchiostoma floridae TaxID=7739 RepID=C3ZY87_BRAFL|eukprot:XP_002586472.1 hypothetical protein BRAFLDRAFT_131460 [Branchiostoma floridae]
MASRQVQNVFPLINLERFFPRETALVIKICGRFEVCDMFIRAGEKYRASQEMASLEDKPMVLTSHVDELNAYPQIFVPVIKKYFRIVWWADFENDQERYANEIQGILVNGGVTPVVQQDELVEALQSRTIQAAVLDVTSPEPLPPHHPLLHMPNVIITPHMGANSLESRRGVVEAGCESCTAAIQGKAIPREVVL